MSVGGEQLRGKPVNFDLAWLVVTDERLAA